MKGGLTVERCRRAAAMLRAAADNSDQLAAEYRREADRWDARAEALEAKEGPCEQR